MSSWNDDAGAPAQSHRQYVLDRARRIDEMFDRIQSSERELEHFFSDPACLGGRYGVKFTDEELFAIKSIGPQDLANLKERLSLSQVAVFDANCSCAVWGKGLAVLPASRS